MRCSTLLLLQAGLLLLAQVAMCKQEDKVNRPAPKLTTLHEEGRIFMAENFLTDEESDHIIELARKHIKRSHVVDDSSGGSKLDDIRTSSGTFLESSEDPLVNEVKQRIADWTLLPKANQESLQVLHYAKTQRYGAHYDYFFDDVHIRSGGNRFATVLMYLNDVELGGETTFPHIPAPGGDNGPAFSDCARKFLAVKPKKGTAVLFHSMDLEGGLNELSFHEACPVIKGEKWSAPTWVRVRPFTPGVDSTPAKLKAASGACMDQSSLCPSWAASGECQNSPDYMLGNEYYPGNCLKSCNRCDLVKSAQAAAKVEL